MNIVVCIKQVPDTTEIKLDPVKGTLIRDGVPSIMNPDDKGALEQALRFKDTHNAHVTVITMGPPQAEAILREAYAMGADHAILVSDRKFGGADTLATSYTLSQALRKIDHDLIIAGRQAIDGDTAQVGPQIAEQLDLPQITYVEEATFDGKQTLTVRKSTEEGHEVLEVELPCMLTLLATANKPRYMRVRALWKPSTDLLSAGEQATLMLIRKESVWPVLPRASRSRSLREPRPWEHCMKISLPKKLLTLSSIN